MQKACRCSHQDQMCVNVYTGTNAAPAVQFDIHSPATTVREALAYSAQLRLADVQSAQLQGFVDEVCQISLCSCCHIHSLRVFMR